MTTLTKPRIEPAKTLRCEHGHMLYRYYETDYLHHILCPTCDPDEVSAYFRRIAGLKEDGR